MPKVLFYKDMSAVVQRRPTLMPQAKKGKGQRNILWMRDTRTVDRGIQIAQKPKNESMVVCFDPPAGVTLPNPFPEEVFIPGRTIFMAGVITAELARVVSDNILQKAKQDNAKPIVLWIDSPGGSCDAGLMIKEAIEAVKPRVTTVAMGGVSSMAAFLMSFGTKGFRYSLESTTLMYHEVRFGQKMALDAEGMAEAARDLMTYTDQLFTLLAVASGNKLEDLKSRFSGKDVFFKAEEAVRAGFLDGVLKPLRYYGPANPRGCKLSLYKSPLQKTARRVLEFKPKAETTGEPTVLNLTGPFDAMDSYALIAGLVSHIVLNAGKDVRLEIKDSPGGYIDEGMGIFDVMRMINALSGCGDIQTFGGGESIEGISALLLSSGQAGKRAMQAKTRMVLRDVIAAAPAYASATQVEELRDDVQRVRKMIIDRLAWHSDCSTERINAKLIEGMQDDKDPGFAMSADEARQNKFIDKIAS